MEITIKKIGQATVAAIVGELNASTAAEAQAQLLPLAAPDVKLILDMTRVPFMSSAGLRLLLMIYRAITGTGGKVLLVGLAEDLRHTMELTGFLDFFKCQATLDAGLAALAT